MKANFRLLDFNGRRMDSNAANEHAKYLADTSFNSGVFRSETALPTGFESYFCVDAIGKEFVWMNETFPAEEYVWYLWFESVFLVPENMAIILRLRWS